MSRHLSSKRNTSLGGSNVQLGSCEPPRTCAGGGGQTGLRTVFSDEDEDSEKAGRPPTSFRRGFPLTPCLTALYNENYNDELSGTEHQADTTSRAIRKTPPMLATKDSTSTQGLNACQTQIMRRAESGEGWARAHEAPAPPRMNQVLAHG
eukprot:scaffold13173_cov35-Tisochrysis_lutea.AAC.4